MALRPMVVKAHFYLPGGTGRQSLLSATKHLDYIGNPKKEELMLDARESAAVHAQYMVERPGAAGYFGNDSDNRPDPLQLAEEIRDHQGPIWRMIVSVQEDDARILGGELLDRPAWEAACRHVVPEMLHKLGLDPDNTTWTAAMHRKEGHPHIHLMFWENTVQRGRGKWTPQERSGIRQLWTRELYGPERARLNAEKTALRGQITQGFQATLQDHAGMTDKQAEALATLLGTVKDTLPGHGRLAYAYMPPETKAAISTTVDWLVETIPELTTAADRYVAMAGELAGQYSDQAPQQAITNARQDLTERLGSAVLRGAVELDRRLDYQATAQALWQAIWPGQHGSETDRQQMLSIIDAIRTGQMTVNEAARDLIQTHPVMRQQAQAAMAKRVPLYLPEDTQKRLTHMGRLKASPYHADQDTGHTSFFLSEAPEPGIAASSYRMKAQPSYSQGYQKQLEKTLRFAVNLRERQVQTSRAISARGLVPGLLRGLLADVRRQEAQAEYLAELDAIQRKRNNEMQL